MNKPPVGAAINHRNRLADGLVGAWLFNEGSGLTIHDHSNSKKHGVITDTTDFNWSRDPYEGKVLLSSANASTARVDVGAIPVDHPLQLNNQSGTIAAKVYFDTSISTSAFPRIIDKSSGSFAQNGWAVYLTNNNIIRFSKSGSEYTVFTGTEIENNWMLVIINFTGGDAFTYGNFDLRHRKGIYKLDQNLTASNTINNVETNLAIGNWNHATDRNWEGMISWVQVWNRSLSVEEMNKLSTFPFDHFTNPRIPDITSFYRAFVAPTIPTYAFSGRTKIIGGI